MVDGNAMSDGFTQSEWMQNIRNDSDRETYFGFGDRFTGPFTGGGTSSRGQNQREYFQNQFQPIFDEWNGQIARNLRQGLQIKDHQTFENFLGGIAFSDRFASLAPSMRGGNRGRFAPQAAFSF